MPITNFPNGISSYGMPVIGGTSIPAMFGTYFFVDPVNGNDGYAGKSMEEPFASLQAAYDACTTNKHDVIVINGQGGTGPSAKINLDAMITWAKNKIHVVGLGTFGRIDMGPEIKLLNANKAVAGSPATIKVTGYGNSFTNCYFANGGTNADSLSALWDAGENTVYTNCQFFKGSDLDVSAVSSVRPWGDSTSWINCKFGVDWATQSVDRPVMRLDGTGTGNRMQANYFENPIFMMTTTSTTSYFVQIDTGNSMGGANIMVNPMFINGVITSVSGVNSDDAVLGHASMVEGQLILINPASNCDSICTVESTGIIVVGPLTHVNAGYPQAPG